MNKQQLALLAKAASTGSAQFQPSREGQALKSELTALATKKGGASPKDRRARDDSPDEVAQKGLASIITGPMDIGGKIVVLRSFLQHSTGSHPKAETFARNMLANLQAYQREQAGKDAAYRMRGVHLDVWKDGRVTVHRPAQR